MTETEIKYMLLEHEKECRDNTLKELRQISQANVTAISGILLRLTAGNEKFAAADKRVDELEGKVEKNSLSLAKLAGFAAAGGVAGAGLWKLFQ